jgi:GDP-L-fucose synthase
MEKESKIYLAGHKGLVGSAIVRKLETAGFTNLVVRTSSELDLRDQRQTAEFFSREKPEYVFLAAARVGGILVNSAYPAEFIHDNLVIQTNVIHQSYLHGVKKLLFLGSSCIYPKHAPQPLKEEYLLTGPLEPTNESYAVAKIAGIVMCQSYNRQYGTNYIAVMPTNLYGPGDNFDLENSHVLPALIRKFYEAGRKGAPSVLLWGTGEPRREFLHVDDLADACLFLMQRYDSSELINLGTGRDISIRELAAMIRELTGYSGEIVWDHSKPDGTPQKLLDISKITALGWKPQYSLKEGIRQTFQWYQDDNKLIERRRHV